jgi:hypothetical protein
LASSLHHFTSNAESTKRGFITPAVARRIPTMVNHNLIYEEALRRVQ